MTTILAPRSLRARTAWVITLTWVTTALVPQITTQSDFAISRGSGPRSAPVPIDAAGPGEIGADRVEEAGIFLGVAQPLDAVALHQPHRAGVEIGPDRLAAVLLLGLDELLGDEVERGLPAGLLPAALALGAGADQRLQQAVGMVDALGIARDLGADDAGRVAVVLGAVHAADAVRRRAVSTSSAQVDGQSCGQAEWPIVDAGVGVHGRQPSRFGRPGVERNRSKDFMAIVTLVDRSGWWIGSSRA